MGTLGQSWRDWPEGLQTKTGHPLRDRGPHQTTSPHCRWCQREAAFPACPPALYICSSSVQGTVSFRRVPLLRSPSCQDGACGGGCPVAECLSPDRCRADSWPCHPLTE